MIRPIHKSLLFLGAQLWGPDATWPTPTASSVLTMLLTVHDRTGKLRVAVDVCCRRVGDTYSLFLISGLAGDSVPTTARELVDWAWS